MPVIFTLAYNVDSDAFGFFSYDIIHFQEPEVPLDFQRVSIHIAHIAAFHSHAVRRHCCRCDIYIKSYEVRRVCVFGQQTLLFTEQLLCVIHC